MGAENRLSFPNISSSLGVACSGKIIALSRMIFEFITLRTMFVIDFFKSPRRLEVDNLFLRHQLSIALRRAPPRLRLRGSDRALLVWMTRRWPCLLGVCGAGRSTGDHPSLASGGFHDVLAL